VSAEDSLSGLAVLFGEFGERLARVNTSGDALGALSQLAVQVLVPPQDAGVTQSRNGRFATVASTGELPVAVDRIQYELRDGPCVDAVEYDPVYRTGDLRTDERWPEFGKRAYDQTGVLSMLAVRIFVEEDATAGMALNMYSTVPDAFSERDVVLAQLLAAHGALAVAAATARERTGHLEIALESNRDIGIAIGVLMTQYKITRESAFDLLRLASQHAHRKLAEIAHDVTETGTITLPS
jgi:GAF domain-containing protein